MYTCPRVPWCIPVNVSHRQLPRHHGMLQSVLDGLLCHRSRHRSPSPLRGSSHRQGAGTLVSLRSRAPIVHQTTQGSGEGRGEGGQQRLCEGGFDHARKGPRRCGKCIHQQQRQQQHATTPNNLGIVVALLKAVFWAQSSRRQHEAAPHETTATTTHLRDDNNNNNKSTTTTTTTTTTTDNDNDNNTHVVPQGLVLHARVQGGAELAAQSLPHETKRN